MLLFLLHKEPKKYLRSVWLSEDPEGLKRNVISSRLRTIRTKDNLLQGYSFSWWWGPYFTRATDPCHSSCWPGSPAFSHHVPTAWAACLPLPLTQPGWHRLSHVQDPSFVPWARIFLCCMCLLHSPKTGGRKQKSKGVGAWSLQSLKWWGQWQLGGSPGSEC